MNIPAGRPEALDAPEGNIRVCLWLNKDDHAKVKTLAQNYRAKGYSGHVSALFRALERMIINDWR